MEHDFEGIRHWYLRSDQNRSVDDLVAAIRSVDHSPVLLALVLCLATQEEFEQSQATINDVLSQMTTEELIQYTKHSGMFAQWPLERVENFVREAYFEEENNPYFPSLS